MGIPEKLFGRSDDDKEGKLSQQCLLMLALLLSNLTRPNLNLNPRGPNLRDNPIQIYLNYVILSGKYHR